MFLATLIISVSRGTPSVTFLALTPAKWKVLRVIYVVGSPKLCAATVPTISPGLARALVNLEEISPNTQFNATELRRYSERTRLDAMLDRISAINKIVAFRWASLDIGSGPFTTYKEYMNIFLL